MFHPAFVAKPIQQFCKDIGCCQEEWPRAMTEIQIAREGAWKSVISAYLDDDIELELITANLILLGMW